MKKQPGSVIKLNLLPRFLMSAHNPFLELKKNSFLEKSDTPIWIASSFFLQRNLASDPFPKKMDSENSQRTLGALKQSLLSSKSLNKAQFFEFDEIKTTEKEFLLERFLATYETQNSACKSGLVIDKSGTFLATINGEDHLVLQCIESHSGWKEGWKKLVDIEDYLAKNHTFAYSNKFGYLTAQLANAGTGLTVQAFLHLPSLIELDKIDEVLIKDLDKDVQVNGLSGSYDFIGDIVIIQNRFTLGLTEDHILEAVHRTATKLVSREKTLRSHLKEIPDALIVDKISRAIGLLKHSYQIDTKEALNAISFIKLGIDLGWIEKITDKTINNIFFEIRRGHLSLSSKEEIPQEKLAQKRAEFLQSALRSITMKL